MYISIFYSGKDKKNGYVKLVEAYRKDGVKKTRIVKNFGRLDELTKDDPQAVEKLKAKYAAESAAKKQAIAEERFESVKQILSISEKPKEDFDDAPAPMLCYGHYPLMRIWDEDLALGRETFGTSGACEGADAFGVIRFMACLEAMDHGAGPSAFVQQDDYLGDPMRGTEPDCCSAALSVLAENKDAVLHQIKSKTETGSENRGLGIFTLKLPGESCKESVAVVIDSNGLPADFAIYNRTRAQTVAMLKEKHGIADDDEGRTKLAKESFREFKNALSRLPKIENPEGNVLLCLLGILLIRLLQEKLRKCALEYGIGEIRQTLYDAAVAAVRMGGDILFFHAVDPRFIRRGRKVPLHIADIMRAGGFKPLTRTSNMESLGTCLGTKFAGAQDAVPVLRLATL